MKEVIKILKNGGVGVLLTDTLYGLVGQALNKRTVRRIYNIKNRNDKKPLIVLIASPEELKKFGIKTDKILEQKLEKFWPGSVSIILSCPLEKFEYLHRGTKTICFRMPKTNNLVKILKITGPLVAPSANPEGFLPARNITEAKKYFGNNVDFYLSGGKPQKRASTIIKIVGNNIEIIRK